MNSLSLLLKVSVSDIVVASKWYSDKLGFTEIFSYEDIWTRMTIPGYTAITYGLSKDGHPTNSGGQVTTFIVSDIATAKKELEDKGVDVGPIENPGNGIQLAFFKDLDGNSLGLRQEPTSKS